MKYQALVESLEEILTKRGNSEGAWKRKDGWRWQDCWRL
jgi:hypothetical protein